MNYENELYKGNKMIVVMLMYDYIKVELMFMMGMVNKNLESSYMLSLSGYEKSIK